MGDRAVTLRAAERADVDAVAAIERESFSDPWSRNAFAALIGNPAVLFLVALAETVSTGETVGPAVQRVAVAGHVVVSFAADESEIANLAVAPAARGRGVGAALLDAVLAEALTRGAAMTYLEVRESNTNARRLYAGRGFAELGRRRKYYRDPTEDALVLGRPTRPAARVSATGVESAHPA